MSKNSLNTALSRVHAQYGKRLTYKDFSELSQLSSVMEVAEYLRTKTLYGSFLKNASSALYRQNLEMLLRQGALERSVAICEHAGESGKGLLENVILAGEINHIIAFMRYLVANKTNEYLVTVSQAFDKASPTNFFLLAQVDDKKGFVDFIKNTRYAEILLPVISHGEDIDITLAEAVLDRYLYAETQKMLIRDFSGAEREELYSLFATKAELYDVEMIYRSKEYYNETPDIIRAMLSGMSGIIKKSVLETMLNAKSGNEVMQILATTPYGRRFKGVSLAEQSHWADALMPDKLEKIIHFSPYPSAVIVAYTELLSIETDNITHIIEGVRYGLMPEEILGMLLIPKADKGR